MKASAIAGVAVVFISYYVGLLCGQTVPGDDDHLDIPVVGTAPRIRIPKTKINVLGAMLKTQIQAIRNSTDKQVELVFLIDSSTSVKFGNFHNELKFVRKLLADFTVELASTRVAVVTFSSRHRIHRHIDHISRPNEGNHKCALLEEQLPKIKYKGGGTYTRGAMLEAQDIFAKARPDASKALFLITDGYSNGGDPRPAAKAMRDDGVRVFTFGIRNGNVNELYAMASEPKEEHNYILDSFEEFEALARRALHEDLHAGHYMLQEPQKCNRLCDEEKLCCDSMSTCRCGTHTGHYECICQKGFYGTGLRNDCTACPSGTYKDNTKPGDVSSCVKCPDINHISDPGSTDISHCVCKKGFRTLIGKHACAALTCPEISPPEHGYFVKNKCSNVFNAACGISCNPGFKLVGSSLRLCQEGGTWSGEKVVCEVRKCNTLKVPRNGNMVCTRDDFSFGTTCEFTCDPGFTLLGSAERACLAIGHWDGITTRCRGVFCSPLPPISDGRVWPPSCLTDQSEYGNDCEYHCNVGFKLSGPASRQCTSLGVWTSTPRQPRCVDNTPPVIKCPDNIILESDPGDDGAVVTWKVPSATDNSGAIASISVNPAIHPPRKFEIGEVTITYFANDVNGNQEKCFFKVKVIDSEPPRIDKCVSPPPFLANAKGVASVKWEEPVFSDNSGEKVHFNASHSPGDFFIGETTVTYTASDIHGNTVSCQLIIIVREDICVPPKAPVNGIIDCITLAHSKTCEVACNENFNMALEGPRELSCNEDNGVWRPEGLISDCSESRVSNNAIQPTRITYSSQNNCREKVLLNQAEGNFNNKISNKIEDYCNGVFCEVTSVEIHCMENVVEGDDGLRRRREAQQMESRVQFDFVVKGSVNSSSNAKQVYNSLMNGMNSMMDSMTASAKRGDIEVKMGYSSLKFQNISFDPDYPKIVCKPGSILLDNNRCVKCPIGSFFDPQTTKCHNCPIGTYQPFEGHLSCLPCPKKTSTHSERAVHIEQCEAQCLPGTFSVSGLEPCETCAIGFYQANFAESSCEACPYNKTTWRRASKSLENCKDECTRGFVSRTGLEPCFPCPRGYFQDELRQSFCIQCPRNLPTNITGSMSMNDCIGITDHEIATYTKSDDERLPVNDCFTEPCVNRATCSSDGVGFVCTCAPGYTGLHCEFEIDECVSLPCLNDGTCQDRLNNFTCLCSSGFTGPICETEVNECASSPCMYHGTCVDMVNEYKCMCVDGYKGVNCEWDVDECRVDPCLNGATCEDLIGRFNCVCAPGFSGTRCEENINECGSSPCLNEGTCVDGVNLYRCVCEAGYSGVNCEEDINECASNPCLNGATCEDGVNMYHCKCAPAFTGQHCETELDPYFYLSFRTSGSMDHVSLEDMPTLSTITVAFWMRSSDRQNYGTPISYASSDFGDNAFTITDYNGFVIYVNGDKVITDVTTNDGLWHHVCVTWSSTGGFWQIYRDGVLSGQGFNLAADTVIPGGGILILGQEQDSLGGGFNAAESFVGNITLLNIWNGVLSLPQVERLVSTCSTYKGNVKAWPDFLSGMKGRVQRLDSEFCKECPEPRYFANGATSWTSTSLGSVVEYRCHVGYELQGPKKRICRPYSEWSLYEPRCQRIVCGLTPRVTNGHLEGTSTAFGGVMNLVCRFDHRLVGNSTIICNAAGRWEGTLGVCEKIQCLLPILSSNLKVVDNKKDIYSMRESIILGCEENYALSGKNMLTCTYEGNWDYDFPICSPVACPSPPKIEHGNFTKSHKSATFLPGDTIKYTCNKGYETDDETELSCLSSGNWSHSSPTCHRTRCQVLPDIRNATKIVGGDYLFGSTVEYECDTGFQLIGKGILSCLDTGSWNASLPACHPIFCHAPEYIRNGRPHVLSYRFNSVVTYTCKTGYHLEGAARRSCLSNRSWSFDKPRCVPVSCGSPENLDNGRVKGKQFTYGQNVVYTCNRGYYLKGPQKRSCLKSKKWSGTVPKCVKIECPMPGNSTNGALESFRPKYVFGDLVRYSCRDGYELYGNEELECQEDSSWSGKPPECRIVHCLDPEPISNGYFDSGNATYGSVVVYKCFDGFRLSGRQRSKCQANAKWSYSPPHCNPVTCPRPGSLINGEIRGSNHTFTATIHFSCDRGYYIKGATSAQCQSNEKWNVSIPNCLPVTCQQPVKIVNGHAVGNGRTFNSVIRFSCANGFELKGKESIECNANGKWSSGTPECEPVSCPDPRNVDNARVVGHNYTYSSTVRFVCNRGFKMIGNSELVCNSDKSWSAEEPKCVRVSCPLPTPIANGDFSGTNFSFAASVVYICDSGYRLTGEARMTCQAEGMWSHDSPICTPVECPIPKVSYGSIVGSNFTYQSIVSIQCKKGYRLNGTSSARCKANGEWDAALSCERVECSRPSGITNGRIVGESFFYNETINYVCGEGYQLIGRSVRSCNILGSWSGSAPLCEIVTCPPPLAIRNGSYAGKFFYFSSQVKYSCDQGFQIEGESTVTCLANGSWGGSLPRCEPVLCQEITSLEHGRVSRGSFTFGSSLTFTCDEGFELDGHQTIQCKFDRQWSSNITRCIPVSCLSPTDINHGRVNGQNYSYTATVVYSCDVGYELIGSKMLRCQSDRKWSSTAPKCEVIQCKSPPDIENGILQSSGLSFKGVVTYTCNEGFVLVGSKTLTCRYDKRWDNKPPVCRPVICPAPPALDNGNVTGSNFTYTAIVTYTCLHGFRLTGSSRVMCAANAKWIPEAPICEQITCPMPENIDHGFYTRSSLVFSSEVLYHCDDGYELVGQKKSICTIDGVWDVSHRTCSLITCPNPPLILNGVEKSGNYTYGSKVQYVCDKGYKITGHDTIICLSNKTWDKEPPVCEVVSCPVPHKLDNGAVIGNVFVYQSTVIYQCDKGYQLHGPRERSCVEGGHWDRGKPRCLQIRCLPISYIENGEVVGNNSHFAAKVQFVCNDGFELLGNNSLQCQENGLWSAEIPSCQRKVCHQPPVVLNARMTGSNFGYESQVRYSCLEGYELRGSESLECLANRSWSTPHPVCNLIECLVPPTITHANLISANFTFGSEAKYECIHGFEKTEENSLICSANRTWVGKNPVCSSVRCLPLFNISFGHVLYEQLLFGFKAEYSCIRGFHLVGDAVRTCQANKTWSGQPPRCKKSLCPVARTIENGDVIGRNRAIGATVKYSCKQGYRLSGDKSQRCGPDKRWSGEAPTCEIVRCHWPQDLTVANGKWQKTNNSYGSVLSYLCHLGYRLNGSSTRVCGADGLWNGTSPACVSISCGLPNNVHNAVIEGKEFTYRKQIYYRCQTGYVLQGHAVRTCMANKQWSEHEPKCKKIKCPRPSEIANGRIEYDSIEYQGVITFSCHRKYKLHGSARSTCLASKLWSEPPPTCILKQCPFPRNITNGLAVYSGQGVDDELHYVCKTRYVIGEDNVMVCLENETWSHSALPVCNVAYCANPPGIRNAVYQSIRHFPIKQNFTYECMTGYQLSGNSILYCDESGSWRGNLPRCSPVRCPVPDQLQNGVISGSPYTFANNVTYRCYSGYELVGPEKRSCQADGTWNGHSPRCVKLVCPKPTIIANGTIIGKTYDIRSTLEYVCDPGFELNGTKTVTCLENKTWNSEPGICKRVQCSLPEPIDNGSFTGNSFLYGDIIHYSCFSKFELVGDSKRRCLPSKTWSGSPPTCKLITCQTPEGIHYGKTETRHIPLTLGDRVFYSCISGFQLRGEFQRKCQRDGTLSGKLPECKPTTCRRPDNIIYGGVRGKNFTYNATVVYDCLRGYKLIGQATRKCQANQTWSRIPPLCQLIDCAKPEEIDNGKIIGDDFRFGREVKYECNNGYELNSPNARRCQESGMWSGYSPRCEKVRCNLPPNVTRALRNAFRGDFRFGDTLRYECEYGYWSEGNTTLICLHSGQWSSPAFECKPRECPEPAPLPHGTVNNAGKVFRNALEYTCLSGYVLQGNTSRVCLADGSWSGTRPKCRPVKCPEPPIVELAVVRSGIFWYRDEVQFACSPGYRLVGNSTVVCLENGNWSEIAFECRPKKCPDPTPLENGEISGKGRTYGSKLNYSCNQGFDLVGNNMRLCVANQTWSGTAPFCELASCNVPAPPVNGSVVGDIFKLGSSITYECNTGYELRGQGTRKCELNRTWSGNSPACLIVSCPQPKLVPHGLLNISGTKYTDTVSYECKEGFDLEGVNLRRCLANKTWSWMSPNCNPVFCGEPDPLPNGYVDGINYTFDSVIRYYCFRGYSLVGESFRRCISNKSWSGFLPSCAPVSCEPPRQPANGLVFGHNFTYRRKIAIICDVGYDPVGRTTRECLHNGAWSGRTPRCVMIECPAPDYVAFGNYTGSSFKYRKRIEYSCLSGYELIGNRVRECLASRTWSGRPPTCAVISCPSPTILRHGYIIGENYTFGHEIKYVCDVGRMLNGPEVRQCLADKAWSGYEPSCLPLVCQSPTKFRNGQVIGGNYSYGQNITYECFDGYLLKGPSVRTCTSDRTWSGLSPECTPIVCKMPHNIRDGTVRASGNRYGDKVRYSCNRGYDLIGATVRSCLKNATWSGHSPVCIIAQCPTPGGIAHGLVVVKELKLNAVISYGCERGFELIGEPLRTCALNKRWSGVEPKCVIISCPAPGEVENGQVLGSSLKFNSSLEVKCNDGFEPDRHDDIRCLENKKWSASLPRCVLVSCGKPLIITNTYFISDADKGNYMLGNKIQYACQRGFLQQGSISLSKCQRNKEWSPVDISCTPIYCGKPKAVSNARRIGNNFGFKDVVLFTCNKGYETEDVTLLSCGEDGRWYPSLPVCRMVICPPPPVIPFATTILKPFTYGNEVSYHCNAGYHLYGSRVGTCMENGTWVFASPSRCLPVTCAKPAPPDHGSFSGSCCNFQSVIKFACNRGYILHGENTLQCLASSQWNASFPSCELIQCGKPPVPHKGYIQSDSYRYNGSVTYYCERGYRLSGERTRQCLDDGSWTGNLPICLRIVCQKPLPPENGGISFVDLYLGGVLTYYCLPGFELTGNGSLTCEEDGQWHPEPPTCEGVADHCPRPVVPSNAEEVIDAFRLGDVVQLRCKTGYVPSQPLVIKCIQSLNFILWTHPKGMCRRVYCGPPRTMDPNVRFMGYRHYYGDVVHVQCSRGFTPVGQTTLKCLSSGKWNGTAQCKGLCTKKCLNGGICYGDNRCRCRPGYKGHQCELAICILPCLNGGTCIRAYQCACRPGYTGYRCQHSICTKPCLNGGKCIKPNRCLCPTGYSQPNCSRYGGRRRYSQRV